MKQAEDEESSHKEGTEPVIINVSRRFISRSQLAKLERPKFETVREASQKSWKVCEELKLPINSWCTSVLYLQRLLVLNPQILEQVQSSHCQLMTVTCACLVTAYLTEGPARKLKVVAQLFDVVPEDVLKLQRDVLESNCFDFRNQSVAFWVVRLAKSINANCSVNESNITNQTNTHLNNSNHNTVPIKHLYVPKPVVHLAWLISLDSYETTAVLQFPAHHVAAACLEIAMRHHNKRHISWDYAKLCLKVVALRTSTRLLLEYYDRCRKLDIETRAPIHSTTGQEQKSWLNSLQRSAPALDPGVKPLVRDPNIANIGTARFRIAN